MPVPRGEQTLSPRPETTLQGGIHYHLLPCVPGDRLISREGDHDPKLKPLRLISVQRPPAGAFSDPVT